MYILDNFQVIVKKNDINVTEYFTNNSNLQSTIVSYNNGDQFAIDISNKIIKHYLKESAKNKVQ